MWSQVESNENRVTCSQDSDISFCESNLKPTDNVAPEVILIDQDSDKPNKSISVDTYQWAVHEDSGQPSLLFHSEDGIFVILSKSSINQILGKSIDKNVSLPVYDIDNSKKANKHNLSCSSANIVWLTPESNDQPEALTTMIELANEETEHDTMSEDFTLVNQIAGSTVEKIVNNDPHLTFVGQCLVKCSLCESNISVPDRTKLNEHVGSKKHKFLLTCDAEDFKHYSIKELEKIGILLTRYECFLQKVGTELSCKLCPNVKFSVNDKKIKNISAHRRTFHSDLPVYEGEIAERKSTLFDMLNYASLVLCQNDNYRWIDGQVVCSTCNVAIEPKKNYANYPKLAKEHNRTDAHLNLVALSEKESQPKPSILVDPFLTPPKKAAVQVHSHWISDQLALDAANVTLFCNIPSNQVNKTFRNTIVHECGQEISPSTVDTRGVPLLHQKLIEKRRAFFTNKKIYVQIDETSDQKIMYANVIVGVLNESMVKVPIDVQKIDKKDGLAMAVHVLKVLRDIFDTPPLDQLCLLVTDAAPAMLKCAEILQSRFTNLIHVLCVAHRVHLVAEKIRDENKTLDWFIGKLKLVLSRSIERPKYFTEKLGVPVPTTPHYIRWGSWIISANYLYHHLDDVLVFIKSLKQTKSKAEYSGGQESSSTIAMLQEFVSNSDNLLKLKLEIEFVYKFYSQIPRFIKRLEKSKIRFDVAINNYKEVESYLKNAILLASNQAESVKALEIYKKYESGLKDNVGLSRIENICSNDPSSCYNYSPITSTECERFFACFRLNFLENSNQHFGDQMLAKRTAIQSNYRKELKAEQKQEERRNKVKIYDQKYIPKPSKRNEIECQFQIESIGHTDENSKQTSTRKSVGNKTKSTKPKPRQQKIQPNARQVTKRVAMKNVTNRKKRNLDEEFEYCGRKTKGNVKDSKIVKKMRI